MKKLINILLISILMLDGNCTIVNGQTISSQKGLTTQFVARNAAGDILANQNITLRLSIRNAIINGPILYQETHNATTNLLGLVNLNIGEGTVLINTLGSDWGMDPIWGAFSKFLQIEMDATGGSSYINMGTTQLMSVPYAMYATNAGNANGVVTYKGTWDADSNVPDLLTTSVQKGFYYVVTNANADPQQNTTLGGINDWSTNDWAIYNGTVWQKVDNSEAPVAADNVAFVPTPAITATNVQAAIEELSSAKVNKTGDTMTGDLILNADPAAALGAATKQYVDAAQTTVNSKVNRSGDTMTGDLILNADPAVALGAATKKYVDDSDALKADKAVPAASGNFAALDATGNLVDSQKNPSQYIDKGNTIAYTPTADYHPATKKYVDDTATGLNVETKADKVTGATANDIALLDASGNLTDGGAKTASNIAFVPTPVLVSTNVQDAIEEVNGQFANLIDSYIHRTDDGVAIYQPSAGAPKRFGVGGDTTPDSPLGIKGEPGQDDQMITFKSNDQSQKWNINLNPTNLDMPGFSIDDISTGISESRLFIGAVTGNASIGLIDDRYLLGLRSYEAQGRTSLSITNTADSAINNGWSLGHMHDNAGTGRSGAFSVFEEPSGSGTAIERITILPSHNVGINETLPYATLHVNRDPLDPQSQISLSENTGILILGPIDDNNIGMDAHQIQARTGEYVGGGTTLSLTASELKLQPYGGGIIINGNSVAAPDKVIITNDGMLGLGTITPAEKIDIDGAIKIGTTTATNDGTIRYTGSDFEGRVGTAWVSFTGGAGMWSSAGTDKITYNATSAKVGIGVATPIAALHVDEHSTVTSGSIGTLITNTSSTSSSSSTDNRIALKVSNTGSWGGSAFSKDIGLYISNVSGQSNANSNIGAVINGNVVIGDVTGSSIVGTGGTNVLAIQTGAEPATIPGSTGTTGIQIYSEDFSTGAGSPPVSVFNVMTGDGHVIKLFRSSAITAPDNSIINSTYGTNEQTIIDNMRTRINQLEQILTSHGLLN